MDMRQHAESLALQVAQIIGDMGSFWTFHIVETVDGPRIEPHGDHHHSPGIPPWEMWEAYSAVYDPARGTMENLDPFSPIGGLRGHGNRLPTHTELVTAVGEMLDYADRARCDCPWIKELGDVVSGFAIVWAYTHGPYRDVDAPPDPLGWALMATHDA